MLLGPVFKTELVSAARQRRYFWLRGVFAALLLFVLWICVTGSHSIDQGLTTKQAASLANTFFVSFAWLSMLLTLLVVPAIAAGAIATERERRTIEYLFATDLSNAEIVLSKLFGKLLIVGKLLVVALPVLAIFRLMGGIEGSILLWYFAALASTATLFTVGAVTISVWSPRARDAVIRVYLVEAVVLLLPWLMVSLQVFMPTGSPAIDWLLGWVVILGGWGISINPFTILALVSNGFGPGMGVQTTWGPIWIQLGLSAVLCLVAVLAVRRVHLRAISSSGASDKKRKWELPQFRPALGAHPMMWKEMFARSAATKLGLLGRISLGVIVLAALGTAIVSYLSVVFEYYGPYNYRNKGSMYLDMSASLATMLSSGMVLLMGLRAASLITYEKERDCWLSLISTPLTGNEIVYAKALGNLYAFRWLLAPIVIIWLLQLSLSPEFILAIPFHLATLAVTGLFATLVGLNFSIQFKSSLKAIGGTIATVGFVAGGYLMCCCVPLAVSSGGEDIFKLAVSGCIPFLQWAPAHIVVEGVDEYDSFILVDYILGMIFYGVTCGVLYGNLINNFEQIVGRTHRPEPGSAYHRYQTVHYEIEPPTEGANPAPESATPEPPAT